MKSPDKFLICKGTSGMGNRIFATCTAILYSRISERNLIIDWRDGSYGEAGVNNFNHFFEFSEGYGTESLSTSNSIYPEVWKDNLETSWGQLRRTLGMPDSLLSIDVSRLDYEQDILIFSSYSHNIGKMKPLFQGKFDYLSTLSVSEILQSILRTDLKLNSAILQSVQHFKASQFGTKTIGVHVRQTDMKIPIDKLIHRTQSLAREMRADCIFLATDAQDTIQLFEQNFQRVVTIPKWFPPHGERLHQNWEHCPDRVQNGIEALKDVYLLAECSGLIFSSQSSFGYLASLLSHAEKQYLHDINRPSFFDKLKARLRGLIPKKTL